MDLAGLLHGHHIEHSLDESMLDITQFIDIAIRGRMDLEQQIPFGHLVVGSKLSVLLVLGEAFGGGVLVSTSDESSLHGECDMNKYNQFRSQSDDKIYGCGFIDQTCFLVMPGVTPNPEPFFEISKMGFWLSFSPEPISNSSPHIYS